MSSRVAPENYLSKLLRYNEDLIEVSSHTDPVVLCRSLFEHSILSSEMCRQFDSLDHSRLKPQLLIRYLLRLVDRRSENVASVWDSFIEFLKKEVLLTKSLADILDSLPGRESVAEDFPDSSLTVDTGEETEGEDIPITSDNVGIITELLVDVSPNWELLAVSLQLKECEIATFRKDDAKISLYKTLVCWVRESTASMHVLKKALGSQYVGYKNLADNLFKKFKEAEKEKRSKVRQTKSVSLSTSKFSDLMIKLTSCNTEVEDGKSTLLYVLASPRESVSYQWHKNGQPLANNSTYSGVDEDILVISPAVLGTEGEYTCCVSLQDKQIISNEINLKVIYSQEKKRLLDLYSVQGEVPKDSWPPMGTDTFIQLVLLEQQHNHSKQYSNSSDKRKQKFDKKTEQKGTDKDVEYEDMFGDYKSETLIIIEGRPGSGKTTLVHKLVKDWCNGTALKNAKLVFLITLRSLNETFKGSQPPIFEYLQGFIEVCKEKQNSGDGACIILDGLDEYKSKNETSVIDSLINKICLPRAMIIVSSRPTVVDTVIKRNLQKIKRIQTLGFSRDQIIKYIKCFPFTSVFSNSDNNSFSSNLEKYLNNHPMVFDMCYLPVHAAMICYLYKHKKGHIPKTQTKIYEEFTLCMILRDLKRQNNEAYLNSLSELEGDLKNNFDVLCKLAFTMTVKDVLILNRKELGCLLINGEDKGQGWCLGLLTVHHNYGLRQDNQYTFLHLTFQEFLAAYYIASLTKVEQLAALENSYKFSSAVWIFLCGLIDLQTNEDLLIEMERYLAHDTLVSLTCAFESQQKFTCDKIIGYFDKDLSFPSKVSSLDIACVKYVTSNTTGTFTVLDMPATDTIALLQNIHEKHFCHLIKLKLYEGLSEKKDLMTLSRILEQCTQLKDIDLRFKNISNASARYVSESFGDKLRYIKLSCISCSEGIQVLLSGLKYHKEVELCLTFKKLCQQGISEVVAVLESDILSHIDLNYLEISECDINVSNAAALRNAIQNCFTLATLEISHSSMNSESTETLIPLLFCLTYIIDLDLSHQQMDDSGAVSLAAIIEDFALLESLCLCHNSIGTIGATAILEILPNLTKLEDIDLSHNNIGLFETAKHFTGLNFSSHRQTRLSTIDLSHNNIDCIGANTLTVALNCCTSLKKLYLYNNKISDNGAAAIGTELNSLLKLKNIDLSNNSIGPTGAEGLAKGLKNFPNLTDINLSNNHIGSDGANAICSECHHLTKLDDLDLSHNNIDYVGINMKKGLTNLISLRCLNISGNCIDINSAIRVIQALKCCDTLWSVDLSREEPGDDLKYPWISVRGIVLEEDKSTIAALESAVQHRSSSRTLDLGFTKKLVEAAEQ